MRIPNVGSRFVVDITKVGMGKDGNTYVTVAHPLMRNKPTFILKMDQEVSDNDRYEAECRRVSNGASF